MRYVRQRDEQLRIANACHSDKTSGHLGYRKTLARITERFFWKGVSKKSIKLLWSVLKPIFCGLSNDKKRYMIDVITNQVCENIYTLMTGVAVGCT